MGSDIAFLQANLKVPLASEELARIIRDAINPETNSAPSDRARVKVSVRSSTLLIEVTAEDLTAFRAAMNSYVAWISGCIRAVESVTGQNP
jgi:tRNA threonylcarbamoyladenosine modification (KEOPS) complex  Pcc1 subunit